MFKIVERLTNESENDIEVFLNASCVIEDLITIKCVVEELKS